MKRTLLHRIDARVRRSFGMPAPWIERSLLGHKLVVRGDTIRDESDYDDAWLYACILHGKTMFDVGANTGQAALMALLSPAIDQVVLVEANWAALAVAAENLVRNGLSARARLVGAFAAEATDRELDFWTVGVGAAGSMFPGHAVTAARAGAVQRVATIALDDLADRYGIVPDLVKVDVEGAESHVLAGSTRIAKRAVTRFFVEMHSPPELPMQKNAELVLAWAGAHDYAAWYLSKGERLASPEPIAHRGRCHLLLQPSAWPYPEWLVGIAQSAPLPVA